MVIRLEDEILNLGQITYILGLDEHSEIVECTFGTDGYRKFGGSKAKKLRWFLTNFEQALDIHNVDTLWAQKDITAAGLGQETAPVEKLVLTPAQVEEALRQVEVQLQKAKGRASTEAELAKIRDMIQNGGRA